MPKVEIKLNLSSLDGIRREIMDAALETIGELRTQVENTQVVPMNDGDLQKSMNIHQTIDGENVVTSLNTDTPYARFIYRGKLMVAENGSSWAKKDEKKTATDIPLNFQTANNPNAQAEWLQPWLPGGEHESFIPETFENRLNARLKK